MEPALVTKTRDLAVEEVMDAIAALTDLDMLKIVGAGRAWAADLRGWSSEDLFQETVTRLLADQRHIPSHINFTYGLITIMQSLANERRKQQTKYWVDNDDEQPDLPVDDEALDELLQEESLLALQKRIGNDNTATDVLNLCAQGYEPEETCQLLSIKRTTYDSARKRIRRAVLKNMKEPTDD